MITKSDDQSQGYGIFLKFNLRTTENISKEYPQLTQNIKGEHKKEAYKSIKTLIRGSYYSPLLEIITTTEAVEVKKNRKEVDNVISYGQKTIPPHIVNSIDYGGGKIYV